MLPQHHCIIISKRVVASRDTKAKEIFEPAFNRPSGTQKHMCMIILHQPGQGGDLRICCACVH